MRQIQRQICLIFFWCSLLKKKKKIKKHFIFWMECFTRLGCIFWNGRAELIIRTDALAEPLLFEKTRIQGKPVRGCPRNPIDETKLEAWTWQPFYIIKSEWLKPDQCREFYTFPVFLKSHLSSLITNTIHVGDPAAGRANTVDQSRYCCFID